MTRYDLFCRTCGIGAGFEDVYSDEALQELTGKLELFAAAVCVEDTILTEMTLKGTTNRMPGGFFSWCEEHKDHDVVVRDEYGRCSNILRCPTCGRHSRCGLDPGHDGKCEPRPTKRQRIAEYRRKTHCETHRRPLEQCQPLDPSCTVCGCGGLCDAGERCPMRKRPSP